MLTTQSVLDFVFEILVTNPAESPPLFSGPVPFGAFDNGGELELAFCDIPDADDPLAPMAGVDAHPSWDVYGIITSGKPLDLDPVNGPTPRPFGVAVAGFACNRAGHEASRVQIGDDSSLIPPDSPAVGRIPDLVRRGLGLACPPPDHPSVGFALTVLWLSNITTFVLAQPLGGPPITWNQIEVLHPAARLLPQSLAPLERRAADAARLVDWGWLRKATADGSIEIDQLSPAEAAWFDDGSFSRWVPSVLPPFTELGHDLIELLPPPVVDRLLTHIHHVLHDPLSRPA